MPTPIKPTTADAQRRLRIDADADLLADLAIAIDGAHAEMLAFLDRDALYEDAAAMAAAVAVAQAALDAAVVACEAAVTAGVAEDIEAAEAAVVAAQMDLDRVETGMVIVPDLINAQLLLADVAMASNTKDDRESKQVAAENIMRRHRRAGC